MVVPCAFVTQRAARSLHLMSDKVQVIFLHQEKLWRTENYWVTEVLGFQPKRISFYGQWRNPAHVLSPLLSAALIASLYTKMLQEHFSLTESCNLYPVTFLKAEGYRLLERDMFLYQLSLFLCLLFFSFTAFLSLLSQIYFFCTAIPFFHCLNLHLVFLSPFFSCPSFIFCKTDISFPYFFVSVLLHPFFHFPFSVTVCATTRRSRKTDES